MTLVSIVTPSFNQAIFLEDCMRSVLAQDYSPIEYIVVDGGSKDNSLEIIQYYRDRLAWWISEPDQGQAEAINKGLKRARGDIVAWLNSDDLYLPGAVSQAVAHLEANPALGMVFGDALTIDAQGRPLKKLTFGNWGLVELMGFRIICQPAVFMRREVLEKAGYLDTAYHFMLDHHLWLRIARLSPIQYIGEGTAVKKRKTAKTELETSRAPTGLWAAARHHAEAKNVAQASEFSRETLRLWEWIGTQTDLATLISPNHQRIAAGAYRLKARYLLDGGIYGTALKSYWKALIASPGFTLKHWKRIAYATFCLLGLGAPFNRARLAASERASKRLSAQLRQYRSSDNRKGWLEDWPGIHLSCSNAP